MYNMVINSSIYRSFPSGFLKNAALGALGSMSVALACKNPLSQIATRGAAAVAATMISTGASTITNLALRNYDIREGRRSGVQYEGNSSWEDKLQTYLPKICSVVVLKMAYELAKTHLPRSIALTAFQANSIYLKVICLLGTIALNLNLKAIEGAIQESEDSDAEDASPFMRKNQAFAFIV